mmetsp:Transcript_24726/g.79875  ORF Transcript_24726/g.79875 Transcript_24726/m.79875 type:complete len:855 (-) Transcript_24726:210-2774(-)
MKPMRKPITSRKGALPSDSSEEREDMMSGSRLYTGDEPFFANSEKKRRACAATRGSSSSRQRAISETRPLTLTMSLRMRCVSTISMFFRTRTSLSRSWLYSRSVHGSSRFGWRTTRSPSATAMVARTACSGSRPISVKRSGSCSSQNAPDVAISLHSVRTAAERVGAGSSRHEQTWHTSGAHAPISPSGRTSASPSAISASEFASAAAASTPSSAARWSSPASAAPFWPPFFFLAAAGGASCSTSSFLLRASAFSQASMCSSILMHAWPTAKKSRPSAPEQTRPSIASAASAPSGKAAAASWRSSAPHHSSGAAWSANAALIAASAKENHASASAGGRGSSSSIERRKETAVASTTVAPPAVAQRSIATHASRARAGCGARGPRSSERTTCSLQRSTDASATEAMLSSASAADGGAPAASSGASPLTASHKRACSEEGSSCCACHSLTTSSSEASCAAFALETSSSSPSATLTVCAAAALAEEPPWTDVGRSHTSCAASRTAALTVGSRDQTSVSISAGAAPSSSKACAATTARSASSTSELVCEPRQLVTSPSREESCSCKPSAWSSSMSAICRSATSGGSGTEGSSEAGSVSGGVSFVAASSPVASSVVAASPSAASPVAFASSGTSSPSLAAGSAGSAGGSSEGIRQPAGICAQSASRRSTSASRRSVAQNGLNSSSLAYSCSAARRTFAFLSASRARPRRATGPKRSVGSARDSQRCESVASALARTKDDVSCSRSTTEAMRPEAASATSGGRGVGIAATAIWSWPKAETAPQRRVYASEARTSSSSSALARSMSGALAARATRKAATFLGAAESTPMSCGESAVTSCTSAATSLAAWCSSSRWRMSSAR